MIKNTLKKIEIMPHTFTNQLLGDEVFGYDIRILDAKATVADYLDALLEFADKYLTDCRGCDGCCHERAPLISTDLDLLSDILTTTAYPAHDILKSFCGLSANADGAMDITLDRDKSGNCRFLDTGHKTCKQHHSRPFVCRSFFCLTKSFRAEALRNAIINAGEDELIRMLWREEKNGAPHILKDNFDIEDYPETGFAGKKHIGEVLIREVISPQLWEEIFEE